MQARQQIQCSHAVSGTCHELAGPGHIHTKQCMAACQVSRGEHPRMWHHTYCPISRFSPSTASSSPALVGTLTVAFFTPVGICGSAVQVKQLILLWHHSAPAQPWPAVNILRVMGA
jgi:hypothetical protein